MPTYFGNIYEDPMAIFTLSVILLPPVKQYFDCFGYGIKELAYHGEKCQDLFLSDLFEYFTDRYFLVACAIFGITIYFTHSTKTASLGWYGLVKANWYILNACFIHILMDGCVGVLSQFSDEEAGGHAWGMMYHQYRLLDVRFQRLNWEGTANERYPINWVVPALMGTMEIFMHAPLCIATYVGYKRNATWRAPVEILASMIQLIGAIIFMYGENMRGVHNLFPNSMGAPDASSPSAEHEGIKGNQAMLDGYREASYWGKQANMGVYYYFGFWFANWVWIVVPAYFIYECVREIQAAVEMRGSVKVLLQNALADPEQFQAALSDEFYEHGGTDGDDDGQDEEERQEDDDMEPAEEGDSEAEDAFDEAEEKAEAEEETDEEEQEDEEEEEEEEPQPRRRGRKASKPTRRADSRQRTSRKWASGQ